MAFGSQTVKNFFEQRKKGMGQIPPKFPPMPLVAPPKNLNGRDPYAMKPKTINDYIIATFDYPSGTVYVMTGGIIDVEAFLFSEFVEGTDYQYRDGKIFIKEQTWTVLLLRFAK